MADVTVRCLKNGGRCSEMACVKRNACSWGVEQELKGLTRPALKPQVGEWWKLKQAGVIAKVWKIEGDVYFTADGSVCGRDWLVCRVEVKEVP